MESGESRSSSSERHIVYKDSSWFSQFRNGSNPWMARYVYALIFLVATLLAWAARDYGRSALTEMERLKGCEGEKDCLGAEGVLRVSLGCFTFFITMFLSTTGSSKLGEPRDSWHSGWWSVKIPVWISLTIIPFLLPSAIIQLYGGFAHFGAGVFLLIQLISIIRFIMWLNDRCHPDKCAERCQIHVMLLATTAYVVCIAGIILMYIWYAPEPSCLLNIFFVTWTLVLLQFMTSVSLHPKVAAGILTPGLMGLYVVFICWCAIRSEPTGGSCIRKAEATDKTDWLTIIVISGFFINLFSSLELRIYDCYLIINFFCDLCLKVLLSFLNLTTDFSKCAFGIDESCQLILLLSLFLLLFIGPTTFLILFMGLTVLFQLTFTFIYSTFSKKFSVSVK